MASPDESVGAFTHGLEDLMRFFDQSRVCGERGGGRVVIV